MPQIQSSPSPTDPRPRGLRGDPRPSLALFYAAHFGHLGIVLPFLPLWLHSVGLGSAAIGVLVALIPLSKLLAPWTWGRLADRAGLRRPLLVVSTLAAAAALALVGAWTRLTALLPVIGLYAYCLAPGLPFAEATALEQAESRGFAYGRVRLWGSMAFIAASAGYGALQSRVAGTTAFLAAAGLLVLSALAASLLPPAAAAGRMRLSSSPAAPPEHGGGLWRLLAACALMQASHGPYYAFYSIRLEELGYGGTAIGSLWALAVICEVLLLTRIDAVLERVGTTAVLRASLVAAALRWIVIATSEAPVLLAGAQALHALTYAAFHVAALREVFRLFGPTHRATGQATYSGLTYGLGIFSGMLAAGLLADSVGLPTLFGVSAAVALAAVVVLGRRPTAAIPSSPPPGPRRESSRPDPGFPEAGRPGPGGAEEASRPGSF